MADQPGDRDSGIVGGNVGPAPSSAGDDKPIIPRVELPKGGGALRGIDEKFTVNPVTGSATCSLPLPLPEGRAGFGPAIGLGYDSGAGNGVFGLGWSVSQAVIQRKTDKVLPTYDDAAEADIFIMSGAEDLVPAMSLDASGDWVLDEHTAPTGERVKRYIPRLEGAFARIERITPSDESGAYWKVTTTSNLVTIFGRSRSARICDPTRPDHIFQWRPELSYDDKGQCLEYTYVAENLANVPAAPHERNRHDGLSPIANTYIKSVRYANKHPYYPDPNRPYAPEPPTAPGYFFTVVFDYGDHDPDWPTPEVQQDWPCRLDPFSRSKAGFDIRTYRLCRRVLAFHTFAELGPTATLVRSLDIAYRYAGNPAATPAELRALEVDYPISFAQTRYTQTATGYSRATLPSFDVTYQEPVWNAAVHEISREDLANAPEGLAPDYQFVDLWSEGIAGILTEQGEGWFYKRNLGNGRFAPAKLVTPKPSFTGLRSRSLSIQDLEADGRKFVVSTAEPMRGSFEISDRDAFRSFKAFRAAPTIDPADPNVKYIDLDGDGRPELVVSEDLAFTWYPSYGVSGYGPPRRSPRGYDEQLGPAVIFSDPEGTLFLADMTGDGLTDLVRIRNGEICYWPNQGFGRFGAKVTMDFAPHFDTPDGFDPQYLRLADINGTGATDVVYLGDNRCRAWLNRAGNAWSDAVELARFPTTELSGQIDVVDLLGTGTACVVWSSPLPAYAERPMRYVDLLGGKKPFVAIGYRNNYGRSITWSYRSSTQFYLDDERAGRPWFTKLAFPVQCMSTVTVIDEVAGTRLTSHYAYHHGYYDHVEREYRGFGMVEQIDAETFDDFVRSGATNIVDRPLHQPPVLTRSWFHTGAWLPDDDLLSRYRAEYFQNPAAPDVPVPPPELPPLPALRAVQDHREATRACKGVLVRQEIYGLDGPPGIVGVPYSAAEHAILVQRVQPLADNRYAVFLTSLRATVAYEYERDAGDARISHAFNTIIDEIGNVVESATVAYPRRVIPAHLPAPVVAAQGALHVSYTRMGFTNDALSPTSNRRRAVCESEAFELLGVTPHAMWFTGPELATAFAAAPPTPYEATPSGEREKRRLGHSRTLLCADDGKTPLPLGQMQSLGLQYESYRLALTSSLLAARYQGRATAAMLDEGKYARGDELRAAGLFPASEPDGQWWSPSGRVAYLGAPRAAFYLPDAYIDPFGNVTTVDYYSDYRLLVQRVTDPLGSVSAVDAFDWRLLVPTRIRDLNANLVDAAYDRFGFLVATAVLGKGNEADDLVGFRADLSPAEVAAFFADPVAAAAELLQHATTRFVYDLSTLPVRAGTIARETHYQAELASGTPTKLQLAFEYSNGFGTLALSKRQTTPGLAKQLDAANAVVEVDTAPNLRWIGSGRTVLNNKGKPVKQYEPYFSTTHGYEADPQLVEIGVTPIMYYDPRGRLIRAEAANGTFATVAITPWVIRQSDQNDTVLASAWYALRTTGALASDAREHDAARKAAICADTPAISHLDSLGRPFFAEQLNRFVDPATHAIVDETYASYGVLDIESHQLASIDPRGLAVIQAEYDQRGMGVYRRGMDNGEHWVLADCLGKSLYEWNTKDGRPQVFHTIYDELRRPIELHVQVGSAAPMLVDRAVFGEGQVGDQAANLRGQVYRHYDQAGVTTNVAFDFAGHLVETTLTVLAAAGVDVDWNTAPALEPETFTATTDYDALGRPTRVVSPSTSAATASVTVPTYSESGRLATMSASVRGGALAPYVEGLDYDEKGQRTRIDYANGASTIYKYDPLTFRLTALVTARGIDPELLWADPSRLASAAAANRCMQFLTFTWDPMAHITHVRDQAQQTIYFDNAVVDPSCDFTYDAVYRLVQATGREHIGQGLPPDELDRMRMRMPQPNDGAQLRRYTQRYRYDAAGNLLAMANANSWSRSFTYAATSNHMLTAAPSNQVGTPFRYTYDEHGNLLAMEHLPALAWSFKDDLQHVALSATADQHARYNYSGGQRIRKVVTKGAIREERLYLGNFERFRRYRGAKLELERETLHIVDDKRRIAMIDTPVVQPPDDSEVMIARYQYANQLGTACLELDGGANVISYEEYYPFGSTSYQATDHTREVARKRYRFVGKERDEETGLYNMGARYFAPWLARWTAADPAGTGDGLNLYTYCGNNPITLRDPTGTDGETCVVYDEDEQVCRTEACPNASYSPEVATGPPQTSSADVDSSPPPQPPPPPEPPEPPPPVSDTDYTLYVPEGYVWTQYNAALREADDSDNPWWARALSFTLATLASPVAYAEEYIGRPIANVPFTMQNAGKEIGEHAGRAYLWQQQGETGEAVVDVLQAVVSTSKGVNAGLSVGIPVSGALESTFARSATPVVEPPPPTAAVTTWQEHEAATTAYLEGANPGVAINEQITLDVTNTTTGESVRIRIDNIYRTSSGDYQLVDAKFSAVNDLTQETSFSGVVTDNQEVAYGWIRNGEPISVVPAGARAATAGLRPGLPISVAPNVQMSVNSAAGPVLINYAP